MTYEYKLKGIIHAGKLNPWKVNKDDVFEQATDRLNKEAEKGWEIVSAFSEGNAGRAIYLMRRKKY